LQAYQDGVNADRMGSDYKMSKTQVNRGSKLKIKLAPGGGWAGTDYAVGRFERHLAYLFEGVPRREGKAAGLRGLRPALHGCGALT